MLKLYNLSRLSIVGGGKRNVKYFVNKQLSNERFLSSSRPALQSQATTVTENACPAKVNKVETKGDGWDARCHVDKATWDRAKPFSEMPGPKKLPLIGNTWRFLPKIGKYAGMEVNDFLGSLQHEYGVIVRLEGVFGLEDAVYMVSSKDVELVYKQEAISPERDIFGSMTYFRNNFRQEVFKDAKGLLTSNGDDWYQFRIKVNSIMMQPKMVKQYIKPVDIIAKDFVNRIKRIRDSEKRVGNSIMQETNKWALETISALAIDQRLGCLEDNLSPDSVSQRMINNAQEIFTLGEKMDFEPGIWRHVSTPTYRKTMKAYDTQLNLAQTLITKATERIKKEREEGRNTNEDKEPSVLEKLLDIDPKVAVVMVSDMLLAGIDTTSTAMVNILYHLSNNPAKQDKLREEILSVLPEENMEVKVEHLNRMPYMRACIKEAARIYPVTPGTMRNLTKDTVLSGYQVPKGTKIFLTHMYLSVDEKEFKRPLEYIPERWLRENTDSELSYKNAHPFATMHFGFGARSCIGRRFAELELEVGLVNIVKNFNMSWSGPKPRQTTTGLNYLRPPFNFVFNDSHMEGKISNK